jgi:hypothetical protein
MRDDLYHYSNDRYVTSVSSYDIQLSEVWISTPYVVGSMDHRRIGWLVYFEGDFDMMIAMIKGATRTAGKTQGYLTLPIRDVVIINKATGLETPAMDTAWTPTPDELDRLNKGANIVVRILGNVPPPMLVMVDTELPEQPPSTIKIVAWRWRSIFNQDSWSYGNEKPADHPQYISEPLYNHL